MNDNGVLTEEWMRALSQPHFCDVNQTQEDIPGCIGALPEATTNPLITFVQSIDNISAVHSDHTRVGFISSDLPNHSIVQRINDNQNYYGGDVIFLPNRELVTHNKFVELEALAPNVGVQVSQMNSTYDTNTTCLTFTSRNGGVLLKDGVDLEGKGKCTGGATLQDFRDKRVKGNNKGGLRMRIIVASSVTYPDEQVDSMKSFSVAGMDAFGPGNLKGEIVKARVTEVKFRVAEVRKTNTPLLVLIANDLAREDALNHFLTVDCGLGAVTWGEFHVFLSPVIGHWLHQLIIGHKGLFFDLNTNQIQNSSGVLCCLDRGLSIFGFGKPPITADQDYRHSPRNNEYLENLKEWGDVLSLPGNREIRIPEERHEAETIMDTLMSVDGLVAFDMEYSPGRSKKLGTIQFCYHNGQNYVLVLLGTHLLGQTVFEEVAKPALLTMLSGGIAKNSKLVCFDFKGDRAALTKADFIDENTPLEGLIDLKTHQAFGNLFRLVYQNEKGQGITTDFGLVHFVQMTQQTGLSKEEQVAHWDKEDIQRSSIHVNYALVDAYAIYRIVEYYETTTRGPIQCNGVLME